MANCNINISERSTILDILKEYTGNNETLFASYFSAIKSQVEGVYDADYIKFLKDNGIDYKNITKEDFDKVVRLTREFYNHIEPDVNFDTKLNDKDSNVAKFGYTSIEARKQGERHVVNFMIRLSSIIENDFDEELKREYNDDTKSANEDIEQKRKSFYAEQIINKVEDLLVDKLITKYSEDDVWGAIEAGNFIKLDNMIKNLDNYQTKNIYALYKEILNNKEEYFKNIFFDGRLSGINFSAKVDLEDSQYESTETKEDGTEDITEENNNDEDTSDVDKSTKRYNNSLGDNVSNYITEIDSSIKDYLGSLRKPNIDSYYGIEDVMDVSECCTMLYSDNIDYTSASTMLASITTVANNIEGFESFHQIIEDCKADSDLMYRLYSNFAKFVVAKLQTEAEGEKINSKVINRFISKQTTLRFEYFNSLKTTSLINDDVMSKAIHKEISDLKSKITGKQKLKQQALQINGDTSDIDTEIDNIVREITSILAEQLRRYYPTLEDTAIANFINNAHNYDRLGNIDILDGILIQTIEGSFETQNNYNSRELKIAQAKKANKEIKDRRDKIDVKEIYSEPYISKTAQTAAFHLADELQSYTPVKTELNSRNVHGNQTSSIINNNMITNLMNSIKNNLTLGNYGKYKFQSRQYDFSNILVEHREKDGSIINFGLFRLNKETNTYEPTEYASRLLKARLFDGATNNTSSKNVLYSEMSKGDYVATSFINFFSVEDDYSRNTEDNWKTANYFMRIPSDAPKNFIINAPKYSADNLFIIENANETNAEVARRANNLIKPDLASQEAKDKYTKKFKDITLRQLRYHLTSKNPSAIKIKGTRDINETGVKPGDEVSITYRYKSKNGNVDYYIMKGNIFNRDGQVVIENPHFYSFVNEEHSSEVNNIISEHFTNQLVKEGFTKKIINKEHPLFKQLRQMFVQELTDAANAINTIFEHNNGVLDYNKEKEELVFKDGYDTKEGRRRLFDVYHKDKDGNVVKKNEKGIYELVGKVFSSDRFVISRKEGNKVNVRNYGNEIIEEAFDFLYGGAKDTHLHMTTNGNGVNIELTDNQKEVIDKKLTEFVEDYINDTSRRLEKYKEFIPEKFQTETNIAEFALNHLVMFGAFNDLFEGDTKFYKDSQTFLKRAKEAQASGTPYGNVNYAVDMTAEPVVVDSRLNSTIFNAIDENGNITQVQYQLKDKFVGVTIKNSIRINKDLQVKGVAGAKSDGKLVSQLANNIAQSFIDDGMSETKAKELALKRARDIIAGVERDGRHGFHGTKVNDAQSYITFDEFIKRMAAKGQFMKYKPLIDAIYDESKPIDAKTLEQFVQVQKHFYYDQYYNSKVNTMAPRQIKNAEFVLIPRFIKGTQLEQVYKLMKKYGIDQLNTEETSKAGKANVLTLWNNEGNITEDNLKDFEANVKGSIEYFSYNNLYTQQEAVQHMNAQNKAGIQIMKKIIDNIKDETYLAKIRDEFFDNYIANIEECYYNLMDRLGIELDENGNIQFDTDGRIKGFDQQLIFDMLKQEVARQGLDSNFLDYVTLNEDVNKTNGITVVPTYFGNKAIKLENISQAIFNSAITRQKLPGFHAAQVTSVGFRSFDDRGITKYTYDKDLYYHPKQYQLKDGNTIITEREYNKLNSTEKKKYEYVGQANYIEVMLPASTFGLSRYDKNGNLKSNKDLLEELEYTRLDRIIGYRIPTEGKQSICVMKVVGILDDAQGSTIVVPDDWVSQTGSDFDFDSVYGITFESYLDADNTLQKVEYHNQATIGDYLRYLHNKTDNIQSSDKKARIEELKKSIRNRRQDKIAELQLDEQEIYASLSKDIQQVIKENNASKAANPQEIVAKNNAVIEALNNYIEENNIKGKTKKLVNRFINSLTKINDSIINSQQLWNDAFSEGLQDINKSILKDIETQAYNLGLMTFQEFAMQNTSKFNTKQARNNKILQCMIEILSSDEAMEENFSRSNFEDIISARDNAIDQTVKNLRENRSCYNFLDQADYQEDVMSGAKLKAFSVTRDTFCSICNKVKPTLNNSNTVTALYYKDDGYNFEQLKMSFDDVKEIKPGVYKVVHNTFGWSKNNRNVVGKLITPYSSQTTAHILDAVKEGAIPNVNDYTFQVYKMFPDLGSDYFTGVSFIMQNGVSAIVQAYNENKSIYSRNNSNPIHTAFRRLAEEFFKIEEIETPKTNNLDEYYSKLKPYINELAELFNVKDKNFDFTLDSGNKLHINGNLYHQRLKNQGVFSSSPVEDRTKLLFDLGVVMQFNSLYNTSNAISAYTRVCNPDKFGAKQSIYSTNKIFEDINEITNNAEKNILNVNREGEKVSLLEAIYPGIDTGNVDAKSFLQSTSKYKSAYPSLNAFLRYATAASIVINRTLFETQSKDFVDELNELKTSFSGGKVMTEAIYKDLQNYTLNDLYGRTQFVQHAYIYHTTRGFIVNDNISLEEERRRIYGYNRSPRIEFKNEKGEFEEFKVKDINHPTNTEVRQFATLSPAQKIFWIQQTYKNKGVFEFVKVSLFNDRQSGNVNAGAQTIQYAEGNLHIESIYDLFAKAFYNNNPLIVMTAADMIKYAFIVEGFKMKRNAINKMIDNDPLIDDNEHGGTNIINNLNNLIGDIVNASLNMEQIRENFIRSHSKISQIDTYNVEKKDKEYELNTIDDMIYLSKSENDSKLASKYGFMYEDTKGIKHANKYVKLRFGKNTVLYKILNYNSHFIAYPLNILESNENSTWSVNTENNKYNTSEYYEAVAKQFLNRNNLEEKLQDFVERNKELKNKTTFVNPIEEQHGAVTFDINEKGIAETAAFEDVIDKVDKHFSTTVKENLYLRAPVFDKYIKYFGYINGSPQTINGKDYVIYKYNAKYWNDTYLRDKKPILERELNKKPKTLQQVIKNASETGYMLNDVYVISPVEEEKTITIQDEESSISSNELKMSSVTELNRTFVNDVKSTAIAEQDIKTQKIVRILDDKDIIASDASVNLHTEKLVSLTAAYITDKVEDIFAQINDFNKIVDPNDPNRLISTTFDNPELMNKLIHDPWFKEIFLKIILDSRALVKRYSLINELDIDSQDESVRKNLTKIKESINKLANSNAISALEKNFANNYLAKLSNNPLVKQTLISVLDGYHSASFMDAWVNDLQETSNPLIQIVTKEVMTDIRAKEMKAYKEVEEIKKKIADIKRRAKEAGYNVNWDNIVDKDGKLVRDYIETFVDELDKLRDEIDLAKINYGENSKKHLEAQYEYNKFKLNYVNQELVDSYYEERLVLDREMLDNYETVFIEYKKLVVERNKILQHAKGGVLEGSDLDEYKRIKRQIDNLTSDTYYDENTGAYIPKRDANDPSNYFNNNSHLRVLYGLNSARALKNYVDKNKEISKKYFKDQNILGFEDELNKNLEIVNSYEQRVNGRITTPANILEMHDDYLKAKSWLEVNARFVLNGNIKTKLDQAFNELREARRGRSIVSNIARRNNLYDRFGQIKADEISEADIDRIRQEQLDNYNLREGQPWQDKSLLSSAPTDDTVFNVSFYQGMVSNGLTNPEWLAIVNDINQILGKHYDNVSKTVYTSELTEDELEQLIELYDKLEDTQKHINATNGQTIRRYINNNVDFIIDETKYQEQRRLVYGTNNGTGRTERYKRLWSSLNERIEEVNGTDQIVANRMLYGYAVPKGYKPDGSGNNSLVDYDKTEALRTIKKYTNTVKTSYYYKKFNEMSNRSEAEFNEWYNKNHIYNPYKREYEPLACWTTIEYVSDDPTETIGSYEASYAQTESVPKDNAYNDDWKGPNSSVASNYTYKNYRQGITDYRNNHALNSYEQEMKEEVERIIQNNAKTTSAKRFFKQGYMIARGKNNNKDAKFYAKEAAKMWGWINNSTGRENWLSDDNVDYAYDEPIEMPFTTKLKNKDTKKLSYEKPIRKANESETEFNQRYKDWKDNNKQLKAENDKIHGELLDRDFESVIEDFVLKSAHYNAIQDNKYMLFYAKNMLDRLDVYVQNFGFNNLQKDIKNSTDSETRYVTKKDTKLQEQYVNWIRRLVYDQWKRPNNKFTRLGNIAQSITSAKFMMLNVTGGIANVTVGYTQIYAEMLANDYFGKIDGAKGLGFWSANIGSFIADMYSDKASSLASAIINFFNVVDFDELNGVVSVADAEEYMKRVRDAAFSPQAIGEHMMQNGALFSMLYSHRLFRDPNSATSDRLPYRAMNINEYMNKVDEQALFNILTDEQKIKYNEFKENQFKDKNVAKEYAQYRRYITVDFANNYLNNEERREFIKKRKELQKQKKEEFYNDEQHPTLISQLKLDEDGKMGFADGSKLSEIGNDAYKLLGGFKGRVISVNKKIHGVYDKLGAAKLESYWWGGLVMQYHKHIYPGIMKRYRRQGYFNEERGTIEKGCYAAVKDFLSLPLQREAYAKKLQQENGATDEEMSTLKSIQNVVKNYVEFATHINLYWNIIPENERGNIKRALGDFAGALSAICTAIALRCIADKPEEQGIGYNLMMYEADRLASESMMYNPFGLISEGKKLWSSPLAVQGQITDMFHTIGFICQYMIQGDEFDDIYQSGMYAGEHKMEVFIKRNIPMYHSIYMLERLQKSNKYYKLGDNMLSIIPIKDIAKFITK